MCEYCSRPEIKVRARKREEIEPDDVCEWRPESDFENESEEELDEFDESMVLESSCHSAPRWLVEISDVSEHLCEQHARFERGEMQEGLSDFLTTKGFDPGEFRPIKTKLKCDYYDPLNPVDCPHQAKYALWVTYQFLVCDEHVGEYRVH